MGMILSASFVGLQSETVDNVLEAFGMLWDTKALRVSAVVCLGRGPAVS